jgi:hypothetical protein
VYIYGKGNFSLLLLSAAGVPLSDISSFVFFLGSEFDLDFDSSICSLFDAFSLSFL